MIDPPRIANLLTAGQHNLNYFVVKKRENKVCKVCFGALLPGTAFFVLQPPWFLLASVDAFGQEALSLF